MERRLFYDIPLKQYDDKIVGTNGTTRRSDLCKMMMKNQSNIYENRSKIYKYYNEIINTHMQNVDIRRTNVEYLNITNIK